MPTSMPTAYSVYSVLTSQCPMPILLTVSNYRMSNAYSVKCPNSQCPMFIQCTASNWCPLPIQCPASQCLMFVQCTVSNFPMSKCPIPKSLCKVASFPEPVFVDLLRSPGIDFQPGGPVRQPYLSYRLARLHRLAESIPRNRFLGSINVYKYGLSVKCLFCVHCSVVYTASVQLSGVKFLFCAQCPMHWSNV